MSKVLRWYQLWNYSHFLERYVTRRPATTGIFWTFPIWKRCNFKRWKCFLLKKEQFFSSCFLISQTVKIFWFFAKEPHNKAQKTFLRNITILYAFYRKFTTFSNFWKIQIFFFKKLIFFLRKTPNLERFEKLYYFSRLLRQIELNFHYLLLFKSTILLEMLFKPLDTATVSCITLFRKFLWICICCTCPDAGLVSGRNPVVFCSSSKRIVSKWWISWQKWWPSSQQPRFCQEIPDANILQCGQCTNLWWNKNRIAGIFFAQLQTFWSIFANGKNQNYCFHISFQRVLTNINSTTDFCTLCKRVSRFSLEKFSSHSAEKFRRGTLPCFTKFLVSKNVRDKRGRGGIKTFRRKIFVSQGQKFS